MGRRLQKVNVDAIKEKFRDGHSLDASIESLLSGQLKKMPFHQSRFLLGQEWDGVRGIRGGYVTPKEDRYGM